MIIKCKTVIGATSLDGVSPLYPGCQYEVDNALGKRLVAQGVAESVKIPAKQAPAEQKPSENPPESQSAQNGPSEGNNGQVVGTLDPEQLQSMTFTELKALAKDMGIPDVGKIKSKEGMIEAITNVEVYADADPEDDPESDPDDDPEKDPEDNPPVFDPQAVVEE